MGGSDLIGGSLIGGGGSLIGGGDSRIGGVDLLLNLSYKSFHKIYKTFFFF